MNKIIFVQEYNVFRFGGCEGVDQARQALHRQQRLQAPLQGAWL